MRETHPYDRVKARNQSGSLLRADPRHHSANEYGCRKPREEKSIYNHGRSMFKIFSQSEKNQKKKPGCKSESGQKECRALEVFHAYFTGKKRMRLAIRRSDQLGRTTLKRVRRPEKIEVMRLPFHKSM